MHLAATLPTELSYLVSAAIKYPDRQWASITLAPAVRLVDSSTRTNEPVRLTTACCCWDSTTLSPSNAEIGMNQRCRVRHRAADSVNSSQICSNASSDQSTRSILFTTEHQVRYTEQGGEERVSPALLGDATAGVHD